MAKSCPTKSVEAFSISGDSVFSEDIVLRLWYQGVDIRVRGQQIHARERIAAARRRNEHRRRPICMEKVRSTRDIAHRRRQRRACRHRAHCGRECGEDVLRRLVCDAVRLCQRAAKEAADDAARLSGEPLLHIGEVGACQNVEARQIEHDDPCAGQRCRRAHTAPYLLLCRAEHIVLRT